MSGFFRGRKVLGTGGGGLIGSAFVRELLEQGARVRTVKRTRPVPFDVEVLEGDLRDAAFARKACEGMDAIVHGAGMSGGSKQVSVDPIPMYTDSLLINTIVMEVARLTGVERFLFVSNSSVYPKGDQMLREEDAENGPPENETGTVKRAGETQAKLYQKFSCMKLAILRTGNAFGPFDNFDLERSHVLPALIAKAVGGVRPFTLWGDGSARRDFIHTSDIARGGLFLLERHAVAEPVNVATGRLVSMLDLSRIVLDAAGRAGDEIVLTGSAPPAPNVKALDLSRMRALGFAPSLSLEEGIAQTVAWFRDQRTTP